MQGAGVRCSVSDNSRVSGWESQLSSITSIQQARSIHYKLLSSGNDRGTETGNSLLKMLTRLRCLKEARIAFARIHRKDLVSWTIIITAYAREREFRKVIQSYQRMLFDVEPDESIFAAVIEACEALNSPTQGAAVHARIVASGLESSELLKRSLLRMYASCDCVESARLVFDSLRVKDLPSWSLMISMYACNGDPEQAIDLFQKLDLEPDAAIITSVLFACSCVRDLSTGRSIQARLGRREPEVGVQNALLHMLVSCDRVNEAWKIFHSMKTRNEVSWNVMISACVQSNQHETVHELHRGMSVEGVTQNLFTLKSLIEIGAVTQELQELLHQLGEPELSLVQSSIKLFEKL